MSRECNSLKSIKVSSLTPPTVLEDYIVENSVLLNENYEDASKQVFNVLVKENGCEANQVEWEVIELPDIQGNEAFIADSILLCASNEQELIKIFDKSEENTRELSKINSKIKISHPEVKNKTTDKCDILEEALNKDLYVKIDSEGERMVVHFYGINSKEILLKHNIIHDNGNTNNLSVEGDVESIVKIELSSSFIKKMPCLKLNSSFNIWLCPHEECYLAFLRFSPAKTHALLHFGYKPYKCDHPGCNWAFYTSFKLKRHKDTHFKKKDFICPYESCDRKFTTIYNLAYHKKLHERPANIKCTVPDCDAVFQTVRSRELHVRTHGVSEAPYKCNFENCNKTFFLATALMSHARVHAHKESEVRCQWPNCGRVFEQPCRLKEHLRQHTGQKPYICTYDKCKWAFTTASKLKRHLNTHTNDRKFQCTIGNCSKAFLRSEHLREHTLTHIGNDISTPLKKLHPEFNIAKNASLTESTQCSTSNVLLEQAVQSLEVPSDIIMGTGILPEESLELLPHESFEKFSTVNLKDLRNLD